MPKTANPTAVPRQRPVSCRFCRTRKLRCSRDTPCTNCVSRGIECDLRPPAILVDTDTSQIDLVERVRKLEELVEKQRLQLTESAKHSSDDSQGQPEGLEKQPIDDLETDMAGLEGIFSRQDLAQEKIPASKIIFRICSIDGFMQSLPYVMRSVPSNPTIFEPIRCIWLPQYPEAKILLTKFVQDIDHIHHVVHTPSLLCVLDGVYHSIQHQGEMKPGNVILLLSIFASSTHSWLQQDCDRGLSLHAADINTQAPLWIKAMEDVLDIAVKTAGVSIEGILGIIIAVFVVADLEGFFRRMRSMYTTALAIAKELNLHCLDHPSNIESATLVRTEMGRRVWWYLVASEWMMAARVKSLFGGMYHSHPRQMIVKKPLNVNDEELVDGLITVGRPMSQPTSMSYFLQRLRLAEIARSIVDRRPLLMASGTASYDLILDTDTELQKVFNELPPFFAMTKAQLTEKYGLDAQQASDLAHQGYGFHSMIYSQRCMLHFPFLSRGYSDLTYASSRDICIQSARLVIQTETRLANSDVIQTTRFQFLDLLVGVFVASMVLLMDLCHRRLSPQQDEQRREIVDAFRILEDARHGSDTTARFLDSLIHIMRKHQISPPQPKGQPTVAIVENAEGATSSVNDSHSSATLCETAGNFPATTTNWRSLEANELHSFDALGVEVSSVEDLSSYFGDLAEGFEQGLDVGNYDWDNLFSGLDSTLM